MLEHFPLKLEYSHHGLAKALAQARSQHFLDADQKRRAIHWPVENK
jgi:hypothetical protein